ncbi:MAG: IPT/TIG domain-containing protein [Zhaonellaceae bacterium]
MAKKKLADIIAKTSEQIVVKTPASPGGTPGKVDVLLVYSEDGQESVIYPKRFEYRTTVGITAVTPNRGSVEGGVRVTITGYNFPIDEEGSIKDGKEIKIFFGSIEVEEDKIEFINSRTILVVTPPNIEATVDVSVVIEKDNNVIEQAVLNKGYQYVRPLSNPKIIKIFNEAINKPVAPISGEVNIKAYVYDFQTGDTDPDSLNDGIFFGPPLLGLKLKVDGNIRDLTDDEKDEIENEFDLDEIFKDLEVEKGIKVTIDDIKAVTGKLNLNVILPIDPGSYDVTLINPDGAIHQLPYYFQFRTTQMEIVGASLSEIHQEGETLRLTVMNLSQDEADNELLAFFLDSEGKIEETVSVEKVEPRGDRVHEVYIKVPWLSSGIKQIYLLSIFGESNKISIPVAIPENKPLIYKIIGEDGTESVYNEENPPTLESSARGPVTGETDIVILGKNFSYLLDDPLKVFIDDVEATVIRVDTFVETDEEGNPITYDRIIAKTGPLVGELPGLKDVTVINPGGGEGRTGVFPKSFYYYSVPQITNVTPNKGHINGGNIITIEGEQFYPGLQIYFERDGIEIENPPSTTEYKLIDNDKLIVRIPNLNELFPDGADLSEPVTIRIENIDRGTATWDKFRVHAPDGEVRIDKLIPDKGPYYGGTRVIIEGSGFTYPKGTVYFGLEEAQIEKWSENEIIVITPAQPEAGEFDVDVTVINEDTSLAIMENGFHYNYPRTAPEITSIFPKVGP